MARLREVSLSEIKASGHKLGAHIYRMMFGDRDPVAEPGTPSGTSGDWWTVFALSPDTFDHACGLFAYYQSPERELDPKLRELGQMRAGWACSSLFVYSQHRKAARDHGVPEEQIDAIAGWQVADCFSPVERAVLAYTDALALGQGRVADDVFAVLHEHLSEVAILEFSYIIGSYIMHATTTRALRLEFDDVDDRMVEVPDPSGNFGGLFPGSP
jgi:alkylhydroperoxidase family enzyme